MFKELVRANRSCRRYHAGQPVDRQTLVDLVDLARDVASARNLQPLRYLLSCAAERNDLIFSCITWPGAEDLRPAPPERPAAYILLLGDTTIQTAIGIDTGIAAQTILLGAAELGLRGCIFGMLQHAPLRAGLRIPERYRILIAIGLGYPANTAILEADPGSDPTAFWIDEQGTQHVRKRALADVLLEF